MISNFHTHNELCRHAGGTVEDYVKEAIKNEFEIIGISDHGPIPNEPFPRMNFDEFRCIYLQDIKRCQIKYGEYIKIYAGVEIEYVYGNDAYYKELLNYLDYMILGTHYYSGKPGYHTKSSYCVGTKDEIIEYTDLICDALDTGYFKILAHPDLFMCGYPDWDSIAEEQCRRIIESAIKNNVVIEYNANGMRRAKKTYSYGEDYQYPNKKFWELLATNKDAKVIVGSDCHSLDALSDWATEECFENLKRLGVTPVKSIFD